METNNQNITIETILELFKNYTETKRLKDIKSGVVSLLTPEGELLNPNCSEIENEVERIIKEDKKLDKASFLIYSKGKYRKRKNIPPRCPANPNLLPSTYIGTAGECAVMSELIFNGYNANRMMIDEGVDIIAVKDNLYYYIQVKTTFVKDNGNIICSIDNDRYDQYLNQQIRYVIVARYKEKDMERNVFFVFPPNLIQQGIYNHAIKKGEKVNIKIRFNQRSGMPCLYDEKEMEVGYYMNNFNL